MIDPNSINWIALYKEVEELVEENTDLDNDNNMVCGADGGPAHPIGDTLNCRICRMRLIVTYADEHSLSIQGPSK